MSEYVWPCVLLGMGIISACHNKRLLAFLGIGGGGSALLVLISIAYSHMPPTSGAYAAYPDSTLYHDSKEGEECIIVKDAVERHDAKLRYFPTRHDAEGKGLRPHRCVEDSLTITVHNGEL